MKYSLAHNTDNSAAGNLDWINNVDGLIAAHRT